MNMTCSWSVWLMTQGCSSQTEVHEVNIKMNNIIHRPTVTFTLHHEVSAGMASYNQLWPKSKCLSSHKAIAEFLLTHSIQTDEYVNSKMMNSSLSSVCVRLCVNSVSYFQVFHFQPPFEVWWCCFLYAWFSFNCAKFLLCSVLYLLFLNVCLGSVLCVGSNHLE